MRSHAVCLFALLVAACGPTVEISPSVPAASPTGGPTTAPTAPPSSPPSAPPTGTAGPSASVTPTVSPLPTPTIGPATPSVTPSTSPGTGFQVLDAFPINGAFEVDDVTTTATGFIAVGFGGLDGETFFGRHQGIVWTSADGVSWVQSVDPSLRNVTPIRVVARGTELFLVGVLTACPQLPDEGCEDVPEAGNALWRSSDGVTWELLPQLPDMQFGLVEDMILAGDQLVVYGSGSDENQTTTAWLSPDGSTWTTTTDLAGLDPISSLTFGATGFSGFGTQYVPELEDVLLTAASSTDGVSFVPASVPQLTGAAIDDVVAGSNGLVGVGYRSGELLEVNGVALRSTDGATWVEATNADGSFAGSGLMAAHALPTGYVAVGFTLHADDFTLQDGATWFSADGADWRALAPLSGAFSQLGPSALGPSGLVVFAVEQSETDDDDVISIIHAWFAPLGALGG